MSPDDVNGRDMASVLGTWGFGWPAIDHKTRPPTVFFPLTDLAIKMSDPQNHKKNYEEPGRVNQVHIQTTHIHSLPIIISRHD